MVRSGLWRWHYGLHTSSRKARNQNSVRWSFNYLKEGKNHSRKRTASSTLHWHFDKYRKSVEMSAIFERLSRNVTLGAAFGTLSFCHVKSTHQTALRDSALFLVSHINTTHQSEMNIASQYLTSASMQTSQTSVLT